MRQASYLSLVLSLVGAFSCAPPGAVGTNAASPEGNPAETKAGAGPTAAKDQAPGSDAADAPNYPEIAPKDLGTINGQAAVFKHAYLTTDEDSNQRLQAFTYDQVDAKEVCPRGLKFISEGSMLQVDFLGESEMKDVSRFYVQTNKPDVKVAKAAAKLQGKPKVGSKVNVEITIEGSNKTKLKGVIEAVVCQPVKKEG